MPFAAASAPLNYRPLCKGSVLRQSLHSPRGKGAKFPWNAFAQALGTLLFLSTRICIFQSHYQHTRHKGSAACLYPASPPQIIRGIQI